jgi:hypothetical protein
MKTPSTKSAKVQIFPEFAKDEFVRLANKSLVDIILHRQTGMYSERIRVTVASWDIALKTLSKWAKTAPSDLGCYDFCDIAASFNDGSQYSFNFGFQQMHSNKEVLRNDLIKLLEKNAKPSGISYFHTRANFLLNETGLR